MGKKTIPNTLIVSLVVLLVCVSFIIEFNVIYRKTYDEVQKEVIGVFYRSLSLDMNKRLEEANVFYSFTIDPAVSKDSVVVNKERGLVNQKSTNVIQNLSVENRQEMAVQSLLFIKNPMKVNSLDSLFQDELKKDDILAKTGVLYVDKVRNIEHVSSNFASVSVHAYSTGKIELGVQKEILVQAFIEIYPYCILMKHKGPFFILLCVWVAVMLALFGTMYYNKNRIFNLETNSHEDKVSESADNPKDVSELPASMIRITQDVILDTDHCAISFAGMRYDMTDQSVLLLKLLFYSPDYYKSYEDIVEALWGKLADPTNRLTQSVKRLRESIAKIPVLKVENVRGKGYRLIIDETMDFDIDEGNL